MNLRFEMFVCVPEPVEEPDPQMSFDFVAGLQQDCNEVVDEQEKKI